MNYKNQFYSLGSGECIHLGRENIKLQKKNKCVCTCIYLCAHTYLWLLLFLGGGCRAADLRYILKEAT